MFSMMRRTVTLQAEPLKYCTMTKKNAPSPIADVSERDHPGPEQSHRVGNISRDACADRNQRDEAEHIAARGPAARVHLIVVGLCRMFPDQLWLISLPLSVPLERRSSSHARRAAGHADTR